jgi:hypothetical protein
MYQDAWICHCVAVARRWAHNWWITSILWTLELMAEAWYQFFTTIGWVDILFVRPYIRSWIEDVTQAYWLLVQFSVETWLVLETSVLLLLAPMLSLVWVPVVLLVHFVKLGLKFCKPKPLNDLGAEGEARSAKDQRKDKQRAHRSVRKKVRWQRRRLSKLLLALTALPTVMATPAECALAATVSGFYDNELGCATVPNLPPEKLLALRSQLQDFSNDIAMLDVIDKADAFPVVVDCGASAWSSFCKADFVPGTFVKLTDRCMKGIAKSLPILGKGLVRYQVVADDGSFVTLENWCYYIPDLPIRLLSPQVTL